MLSALLHFPAVIRIRPLPVASATGQRQRDPLSANGYAVPMTRDDQRAYVRRWVENGPMLEEIRWRELRALDCETARRAFRSFD